MKKVFIILLGLTLLLTGCAPAAPAQETEPVQTEAANDLKIPERYTGDWTGVDGKVVIHADATVNIPENLSLPTAKVNRHPFNQADVDNLMEVFLKGTPLYEEIYYSKQDAERNLALQEARVRGEAPLGDAPMEKLPAIIERIKGEMDSLPDEKDHFPKDAALQSDRPGVWTLDGFGEPDGEQFHILIRNEDNWGADRVLVWREGYGDTNTVWDDLPPAGFELPIREPWPDFQASQAQEMGDRVMEGLGLDTMICDQIIPVEYLNYSPALVYENPEEQPPYEAVDKGYRLDYIRTVNGFPVCQTPYRGSATPENVPGAVSWDYERVQVWVAQSGVVYFLWVSPYEDPEIVTETSKLIDFPTAAEVFEKMLFVKYDPIRRIDDINGDSSVIRCQIDEVRLSLMRIRSSDSTTEGTLVPVWDFWGVPTWDITNEDNCHTYPRTVLFTVNALDGTAIDRELGY